MNFVGVGGLDGLSAMEAFVASTGVNVFPNIFDERGEIWAQYGIGYQPAFIFLPAEGGSETTGALNLDGIQERIDALF